MITLTPGDVLDIPLHVTLRPIATTITGVAIGLVPFLFISELLFEQTKLVDGKGENPNFFGIIFRTIAILFSLVFLYEWVFLKIVAICEAIALAIDFKGNWDDMVKNIYEGVDANSISLTNLTFSAAISSFFSVVLTVIETVFKSVRYILLSILYCIGPLAYVAGISRLSRAFLKGWFKNLFEISFWIIIMSLLQASLLAINSALGFDPKADVEMAKLASLINGFVMSFMMLVIPSLTKTLLSANGGLGALGAAAIAGASGFAMTKLGGNKLMNKTGKSFASVGKSFASAGKSFAGKFKRKPPERDEMGVKTPKR